MIEPEIQAVIDNYPIHSSMRGFFGFELFKQMAQNKDIWLITPDLGFGLFDMHFKYFPERTKNTMAAEQSAMGIAVGLAMSGKIPVFYSITPFALFRPAETIRLYVNGENVPVKIVGGGRDKDYSHDGPSHHADDAKDLLNIWPNIKQYWPEDKEYIKEVLNYMLYNDKPSFLSLRR